MAQITGQAGTNLSSELATYLSNNQGSLTSDQIVSIINQYLTGGDKVAAQGGAVNTGIYKPFGEFDQITGKTEIVTTGLWSGDAGSLTTFFSSPTQPTLDYYINAYNTDPDTDSSAAVQFAVAYGNKTGLGSVSLANDDLSTLATKATYAQYRSILLDRDDEYFTFLSSSNSVAHDSDDIYVVNLSRSRYRESMDPGNFSLTLSGTNGTFTFIDDSGKKFDDTVGKAGRVFNIVQGDLNLGTENAATVVDTFEPQTGQGYGLFYPDQGLLVLNPGALASLVGTEITPDLGVDTPEKRNHIKLFDSIKLGGDFEARRTENISTAHYFVRATNREYNFSNNPSFVTGSDGTFVESSFERDPKTYITTVGLYNNSSEMLAVAKTSQPIPKSFDREILIKIKLDF